MKDGKGCEGEKGCAGREGHRLTVYEGARFAQKDKQTVYGDNGGVLSVEETALDIICCAGDDGQESSDRLAFSRGETALG